MRHLCFIMTQTSTETPWLMIKRNDLEAAISLVVRNELSRFNSETKEKVSDNSELLTRSETCQMLKISNTTLHRYVHAGSLVPVYIGKAVRFRRQEIIDIVKSQER